MADRDAHLADPEAQPAPLDRLLDKGYARRAGRPDRPRPGGPPAPARLPRGGGTIWLGVVDAAGNAVSLIESNYAGFGSGIVDPVTGIAYQNRGSYFSLDEDHPNVLGPSRRVLHTLMPGMLFRDGRPWIVHRLDGRRCPAAGPRPGRLGARRRPSRRGHGGRPSALVRRTRRITTPRRTRSGSSRASRRVSSRGSSSWATGSSRSSRSTARSAIATRSSWSTADPPRAAAWPLPPIPAARACPATW